MFRILFLLSALLPLTLAAHPVIGNCGTKQVKTDAAFLSGAFASDTNFCKWYLSSNRIRSPLAKVPTGRLLKACECKLQRKRVKATKYEINTERYQPKCVKESRLTLENKVRAPRAFCKFWQFGLRKGTWRSSSPFVKFGIRKVYDACHCYTAAYIPPKPVTTSSMSSSTTTTSSTSSRSSSTSASASRVTSSSGISSASSTTAIPSSTAGASSSSSVTLSTTTRSTTLVVTAAPTSSSTSSSTSTGTSTTTTTSM